jgi:hypothetical protein
MNLCSGNRLIRKHVRIVFLQMVKLQYYLPIYDHRLLNNYYNTCMQMTPSETHLTSAAVDHW